MNRMAVALAGAIAVAAAWPAAAVAVDNAGQSGGVSWQVLDAVQSRLAEEQATRWDFAVALQLTAPGEIAIERVEFLSKGQAQRPRPLKIRLRSGETIRIYHSERTTGETSRDVVRRYVGHDDKGGPVVIDALVHLDPMVGARTPAPPSARVAPPSIDSPLPSDLRVIPPAAGSPARWAGFSGVWTGHWAGSGRPHALVVEEVGSQEAVVVYSVGAYENRQPTWFRRRARIKDDRLTVELAHDERVVYTRTSAGLAGAWTHDGGRDGRVALTQPSAVAKPSSDGATSRAARLNAEALTALLDGQYADALPRAQEALALREAALGPAHPDVAVSLTTLAEVYRGQGRLADAERLHRQALGIREQRYGKNHPDVAASLNYLAVLYNAKATYREAEELLRRALEIVDKGKGAKSPAQVNRVKAEVLENLAKVYRAQGRAAEAEEAQAKAAILWAIQ